MVRGKHIVIEGGDGTGKSTQAEILRDRLRGAGLVVDLYPEPGKEGAEAVFRRLMTDPELNTDAIEDLLIVNASRAMTARRREAAQAAGEWAISDRSLISSVAMQGHAEGLDLDAVRSVSELAARHWNPELTLILSAPVDVIKARMAERGQEDKFEQRGPEYHQAIIDGYEAERAYFGGIAVDASGTVAEVHEVIWEHVEPLVDAAP